MQYKVAYIFNLVTAEMHNICYNEVLKVFLTVMVKMCPNFDKCAANTVFCMRMIHSIVIQCILCGSNEQNMIHSRFALFQKSLFIIV